MGDLPITVVISTQGHQDPTYLHMESEFIERRSQFLSSWTAQFPKGKFVTTSDSGHYIHHEEPKLVQTELNQLLDRVERGQIEKVD